MWKGLLVLEKSKATVLNNKYTFKFPRGISFNKWRIRNIKHDSTETKLFLHSDIMEKTINNSLLGNGQDSDIILLISSPLQYTSDRFNLYSRTMFFELTFYFTDGSNVIAVNDFNILLDYEKPAKII